MKNKKEKTVKEIFEMVKNDGHEFIVSGEFEKIALAKPVGITKSPEKIDLSKYIKQHEKYNKGFIKAGEYQPIFRTEYYKAIWRVWLQKEAPERYKKFSFFAYITRQFIYRVLARKELHYDNAALGILLKQLDEKNPDRKVRHHQFLDKVGRTALDRQITAFITICDGVKNKDIFKTI